MDGVIAVVNLIGAPSTRHQTEEAGPTRDYTEKGNEAATAPSKAHPGMDYRRLVTKRGSANRPKTRACGESSEAKTIKIKLCRQDREQEDLIRRIHQETTEEEAEEEPAETLECRPKKRDREQRGEELVPVGKQVPPDGK